MSYNTVEPAVIDEDIIRKCLSEQLNTEIAEIARKEGVDVDQVVSLRLDYKNILKIENLSIYANISKLQLDNNIIEKIDNLGALVNLIWLDLSFNNIAKIEGLSGLNKLTDLTLFNNRISVIGNMDDLINLQVFSIGNNAIAQIADLEYLTRFKTLRVFNFSGNPATKSASYKNYTLAHLRGLKYLDYKKIDEEDISKAHAAYVDSIIALEEEEKVEIEQKAEVKKINDAESVYEVFFLLIIEGSYQRN